MAPSQVTGRAPLWRRMARIVLIQIGVALGLLLLLELGTRVAGFGSRVMYTTEGELLWKLIPNQRTRNQVTSRPVTIDAAGMRIVPGATDGPGRATVLCLGNSISYGYGVADSETYESLLQRGVERRSPGRWRFVNGAVMGYNLYYERLWLAQLTARGFHPDFILLGFTFNDVPSWPGEHYGPEERERIRRSIHFKNVMRHIGLYNVLVERMMTPELYRFRRNYLPFGFGHIDAPQAGKGAAATPPPAPPAPTAPDTATAGLAPKDVDWHEDWMRFYCAELNAMLDAARDIHVPVLAVVWPDPNNMEPQYRKDFMEICTARGVPYVDLQPVLERHPKMPFLDQVHPASPSFALMVDEGILPFWLSQEARLDSLRAAAPRSGS